jgi:hypothetical protein
MRWYVFAGFVLLAGAAIWVFGAHAPAEPSYLGKPLRYWVKGYGIANCSFNECTRDTADEVVRRIGTNAIPTLLEMLTAKDSALDLGGPKWSHIWRGWAQKQHLIKVYRCPHLRSYEVLEATQAFCALGSDASNAVPALIKFLQQNPPVADPGLVEFILGKIGPPASEAVPALLKELNGTDSRLRVFALFSLPEIHAAPDLVKPALMKTLEDSDSNIRLYAALALEAYGTEIETSDRVLADQLKRWHPPRPNYKKPQTDPNDPLVAFQESIKVICPEPVSTAHKK